MESKDGGPIIESVAPQPFLKWAGGKRALLREIKNRTPDYSGTYFEPFLGAGAVLFNQDASRRKCVSDFNEDLIEVYEVVRDQCLELIDALKKHENTRDHYYFVREWDRDEEFRTRRSKVERAARFIYLNKTTYNGLYRVNSKGQMNVPFGNQASANWIQEELLSSVSSFLNVRDAEGQATTRILSGDYKKLTAMARRGDFVYLDPPYAGTFTQYQSGGFSPAQQIELRDEAVRLTEAGVPLLLSNSDVPAIHELYNSSSGFTVDIVNVRRAIGAKLESRSRVQEVLINNYAAVGV